MLERGKAPLPARLGASGGGVPPRQGFYTVLTNSPDHFPFSDFPIICLFH